MTFVFCCFAVLLFCVNLLGIFFYRSYSNKDITIILDNHHQSMSFRQFLHVIKELKTRQHKTLEELETLVDAIHRRMLHINPKNMSPSFCENYMLWFFARVRGAHEYCDVYSAARMGGGYCSTIAMLLVGCCKQLGISARFIIFPGHVINEVFIDGQGYVVDADTGYIYTKPISHYADCSSEAREELVAAGVDEIVAIELSEKFTSPYIISHHYRPRLMFLQRFSQYFIWFVPLVFVICGLIIY